MRLLKRWENHRKSDACEIGAFSQLTTALPQAVAAGPADGIFL